MHLVLIETSGNQRYIFATNKLRENVGASQLVWHVGTQLVAEAVAKATSKPALNSTNPEKMRAALLDPARNMRVEHGGRAEIVFANSGKALLLTTDESTALAIVRSVTRDALEHAPGVEVHGVVAAVPVGASVHQVLHRAYTDQRRLRAELPGPAARFLRLPVAAACGTSGLPAHHYDTEGNEETHGPRSLVSLAKQRARGAGFERVHDVLKAHGVHRRIASGADDLERFHTLDWTAVVHADGNGIGALLHGLADRHRVAGPGDTRAYIDALRGFSFALDRATERAFCAAVDDLPHDPNKALALVPLVLGGDDLTVLCDGRIALEFTRRYLGAFEREVAGESLLRGVSSCAGVAITKPHFPFHRAYELAEGLIESAKQVKHHPGSCSAFDYHVLYDASGADLRRIRAALTTDDGTTSLVGRPCVVTAGRPDGSWCDRHHVDRLAARIAALSQRRDGKRVLPNSQLHDLREALHSGRRHADARFELMRHRYPDEVIAPLDEDGSLFWNDGDVHRTGLLDAIEALELWEASR